jgi:cell division protein FtsZ
MKFDIPQELNSIIKVIGVGGGGSNAVNHMYQQGIRGVDFIVCNTDRQALDVSPVPVKVQLGVASTGGLGAGSVPERGREAVQENLDELRLLLSAHTKMVFITAGMGGGTGTGAAPVIAQLAREMGILTVGIVTSPFQWEGRRRKSQAVTGEEELRNAVDTLLVINNDRLRDLFGNLSVNNAFEHADNVLTTAARGIAEIITKTGKVNVDFEDVKTVMTRSGNAIMGMAEAEGEDRALRAAQEALDSPLLNDSNIAGAKFVLLNITYGTREILMDEIGEITDHIQQAAGSGADVIWGYGMEENLGDKVRITVIATGFETGEASVGNARNATERTVIPLDDDRPTMITQPIVNPVAVPVAKTPASEAPAEPYIKQVTEEARSAEASNMLAPQGTIEFEVDNPQPIHEPVAIVPEPEKIVHTLGSDADVKMDNGTLVSEAKMSPAEHQVRVEERQARMRAISQQLRSPGGIADMEQVPAYKRKNILISEAQHSADSNVSRYTLNEEVDEHGERRVELKRNNPFLHDNVD